VVFNSFAGDLVANDRNETQDAFLFSLPVETVIRVVVLPLASGDKPTISWNVYPGRVYAAEYTDSLDQPWKVIPGGPVSDGEGRMKQEDAAASGAVARFYRVVQLP
jgi:hypothetical protein